MDTHLYLKRIGCAATPLANIDGLRELQFRHMTSVPFENLDIHAGRPIRLDEEALFDKVVKEGRGGFCYELNGLFSILLKNLGFDCRRVSARVRRPNGAYGPEFSHMTLLVRLDGEDYLADVGFGDFSIEPLPLKEGVFQVQNGEYELVQEGDGGWRVFRRFNGETANEYRFSTQAREIADFQEMCLFHQTSPMSPFTQNKLCTIALPNGRLTLTEKKMKLTGSHTQEEPIENETVFSAKLMELFGINFQAIKKNG